MRLLKKNNFWLCLVLDIITGGLFTFYIAKLVKSYNRRAWYHKSYIWLLTFFVGFFLRLSNSILTGILYGIGFWLILFLIFYMQVGIEVSTKLGVPLSHIYGYPYIWILCLIIPIFGWALFIVLDIYIHYWYIFYLKRGNGEAYIK